MLPTVTLCQIRIVVIDNKVSIFPFLFRVIINKQMKKTQKKSTKNSEKGEKKAKKKRFEDIPYGREAVKKAILNATQKLLAKRNPNEITVREIAKAANVKHPLIYRHFGTKDNLIREAHTILITKINASIPIVESIEGNAELFFAAVKENKFRQLALARAMIEGISPHLMQNQFPVMQRVLKLLKRRGDKSTGKFSPEISTAALGALVLGWTLYEPFLLAATNLETEDKAEIDKKIVEILEEFVQKIC